MKFIEKKLEDSRTGAIALHHFVSGLNVDYANNTTNVTVSTFVSKEKKEGGKEALSINTFTIPTVPDWDQIPYQFALEELIKEKPEDFVPEEYFGYVDPYMFSGGVIKAK